MGINDHDIIDVAYLKARCGKTHTDYKIRIEQMPDKTWQMVRSCKVTEGNSSLGENKRTKLNMSKGLFATENYRCPHCGNTDITIHSCSGDKITCYDGSGYTTCAYCEYRGEVGGSVSTIEAENTD